MMNASTHNLPPRASLLLWLIRLRWVIGILAVGASLVPIAMPGLPWGDRWVLLFGVGVAILAHNALLVATVRQRAPESVVHGENASMILVGAGLDLIGLSILTAYSGGVSSPFLMFFSVHVVLAGAVFRPWIALAVAISAISMLLVILPIADAWPQSQSQFIALVGWGGALALVAIISAGLASSSRSVERGLLEAQRRADAVLDTAVEGIITIDRHGVIVSSNQAAARIFGYAHHELEGQNVSVLMSEPDHSQHDRYIENYLRTGNAKIIGIGREVEGRTRSGNVVPIDLSVSEVRLPSEVLFTALVRDLSEQKKAEAEIRDANIRLSEQQAGLAQQEKLAAVGQLAAGVAHEVSNPLAAIDSILQLADRRDIPLNAEQVASIRVQVGRMGEVLHQITSFAHPGDSAIGPVSLREIAEETLDLFRLDHRIRRVHVEQEYLDDGATTSASARVIQQVAVNLLSNALDALDNVDEPRLVVRTNATADECTLEVIDNGPGVPAENRAKIFDPFFTTKPPGKGTGLGLSISVRSVAEFRGRLTFRTTEGGGATFEIALPRTGSAKTAPSGQREHGKPSVPDSKNDQGGKPL